MSRLNRLSARAYGRLTPARQEAVDALRWLSPSAAERAEAKTTLGWRRSREETLALALELRDRGLVAAAIADRLGVGDRYLRRLLSEAAEHRNGSRNPTSDAGRNGTNRQGAADSLVERPRGPYAARVERDEAP